MRSRDTWCEAVGTLLTLAVSAIVVVVMIGGLLVYWHDMRPVGPAPAGPPSTALPITQELQAFEIE